MSAYIPTNVISITDGQIFLESELFNQGIRPAINAGLSVSRVGSAAQLPEIKKVSGSLKLVLAQYREIKAFEKLGASFDKESEMLLRRGTVLTELLKQKQYDNYKQFELALLLLSANKGYFDNVEYTSIKSVEEKFVSYIRKSVISLYTVYKFYRFKTLSPVCEFFIKNYFTKI